MSRLDDLKEKLKSAAQRIGQSIQETELYNKLNDRYQSLSANSQKFLWLAGSLLIAAIILFYPLGKLSDSQSLITAFEEKRALIRELFRTYRESSGQSIVAVPPRLETLKAAVETILTTANLIPEQKVGILQSSPEGRLIPASLVNNVLEIKLAKLNLKQIVDIGTSIAGISDSVKMKDLIIAAHAQDTRYFDVTYKLYSLNVPEPLPEAPPEIEVKPKKGSSSSKGPSGKGSDSGKKDGDIE